MAREVVIEKADALLTLLRNYPQDERLHFAIGEMLAALADDEVEALTLEQLPQQDPAEDPDKVVVHVDGEEPHIVSQQNPALPS